jgi:hypothetical protein
MFMSHPKKGAPLLDTRPRPRMIYLFGVRDPIPHKAGVKMAAE